MRRAGWKNNGGRLATASIVSAQHGNSANDRFMRLGVASLQAPWVGEKLNLRTK